MILTLESLPRYCHEVGECWHWAASCNGAGYPQANVNGRVGLVTAHVWRLMGKSVPSRRYCLVTTCNERLCVRPGHIALRSRSSTLRRAYAEGKRMTHLEYAKRLYGSQHLAKLPPAQVAEIRARPAEQSHASIAREYGVTDKAISEIRRGITWRTALPASSVFAWADGRANRTRL